MSAPHIKNIIGTDEFLAHSSLIIGKTSIKHDYFGLTLHFAQGRHGDRCCRINKFKEHSLLKQSECFAHFASFIVGISKASQCHRLTCFNPRSTYQEAHDVRQLKKK